MRIRFRTAISYFFTNLLIVSMALVTAAANMLAFALVWEIMSISSYFLVMYDYEKIDDQNCRLSLFSVCPGGGFAHICRLRGYLQPYRQS